MKALDQEMAAGEEADEDALEHLVLPGNDAFDLEDGALEQLPVGAAVQRSQMSLVSQSRSFMVACSYPVQACWRG